MKWPGPCLCSSLPHPCLGLKRVGTSDGAPRHVVGTVLLALGAASVQPSTSQTLSRVGAAPRARGLGGSGERVGRFCRGGGARGAEATGQPLRSRRGLATLRQGSGSFPVGGLPVCHSDRRQPPRSLYGSHSPGHLDTVVPTSTCGRCTLQRLSAKAVAALTDTGDPPEVWLQPRPRPSSSSAPGSPSLCWHNPQVRTPQTRPCPVPTGEVRAAARAHRAAQRI